MNFIKIKIEQTKKLFMTFILFTSINFIQAATPPVPPAAVTLNDVYNLLISTNANIPAASVNLAKAQLYNRSQTPVNVYMYSSLLMIGSDGVSHTVDENGLINSIGMTIPGGGSINWAQNTRSVAVYYQSKDPIVANIQPNYSYNILPSADKWTIVQKIRTP